MRKIFRRVTGSRGAEGSRMLEQITPSRRAGTAPTAGPPKVLVILGHPRRGSLCEALANAYAAGAENAGAEVRRLSLPDLSFEQNVLVPSPRDQAAEPGISDAVDLVAWAEPLEPMCLLESCSQFLIRFLGEPYRFCRWNVCCCPAGFLFISQRSLIGHEP